MMLLTHPVLSVCMGKKVLFCHYSGLKFIKVHIYIKLVSTLNLFSKLCKDYTLNW